METLRFPRTLVYTVWSVVVPSGCNIIPSPGLVSFLQKKILYKLALSGALGQGDTIPNCPNTLNITVKAHSGNCMGEIGSPDPSKKRYGLCGEIFCLRTCAVCLSTTETDPCTNEPMVVFTGCSYSGQPCTGVNQGCNYNTCVSN